jgi:hypothetical protein
MDNNPNRRIKVKYLLFLLPLVASCQYLPQLSQEVEDISTDRAIKLEVSKETFQKETDLEITIAVQNKDQPKTALVPMKGI